MSKHLTAQNQIVFLHRMQPDKVIGVKKCVFYISNDHRGKMLIIQYTKQSEILTLLDPRFEKAQLQMFYNNIKNTLFLNSITHTNSGLSLGAFPQGKKVSLLGNDVLAQNAQFHVCGTGSEELGLILMCISRGMPFHTVSLVLINGNVQDQHNYGARN